MFWKELFIDVNILRFICQKNRFKQSFLLQRLSEDYVHI